MSIHDPEGGEASALVGEFARIDRFLKPLAAKVEGALGLDDDAAVLSPPPGKKLVVTTDTMVEGVHWLPVQSPSTVARKLLRVNLSDLAAMGAEPWVYTLNTALGSETGSGWLEQFAQGLSVDQDHFGIGLAGGDSVSTSGPAVVTITAFGLLPADADGLRRSSATVGDSVFVTGTLGDAYLGLRVMKGEMDKCPDDVRAQLSARFELPTPRLDIGKRLVEVTPPGACLDVSDGLVGDAAHIARSSGVGIDIFLSSIPISSHAAKAIEMGGVAMAELASGGDDYELLFTARDEVAVDRLLGNAATPITKIGTVVSGNAVRLLDASGREIESQGSWTHF